MATEAARYADGRGRSVHHEVLHRLVAGAAGSTTAEIQLLYDAVAPIAYRGTTDSPVQRRRRREVLRELTDESLVTSHDTPRGRVWVPLTMPDGMDIRYAATEARREGSS